MNKKSAGPGTWARSLWLVPLVVSLVGCGGGSSSDAMSDAPPPEATPEATPDPAPAATLPEAFRGQWEAILSYVPPFYSGPYGDVPQGDGSIGITFYFYPDGRYQYDWSLARAYFGGNCFQTSQWQEVGQVAGGGPDFTFTPGHASYLNSDSCGQFRYVDPAPVVAAIHTMTLDHDASGWPLLRMSFPTGELVLEKCRRCQ
jgi:hypothetical protein